MANIIQIKTRASSGTPGAPTALARGELAVNFAGANAGDTVPAVYIGDGAAVQTLLDQAKLSTNITIGSVSIPVATPGSPDLVTDANAAPGWTVAQGEIKIVSHDGAAYMFTGGPGSYGAGNTPTTAAMFAALGAAAAGPTIADAADIRAGTDNAKMVTAKGLAAVLPPAVLTAGISGAQAGHPSNAAAATGVAADANRIVTLGANGKIAAALLPVTGFDFQSADLTAAPPAGAQYGHQNGRVIVNSQATAGAIDAGWTPVEPSGATVQQGDMLLSDGTTWHLVESSVDMTQFVGKSGAQNVQDDMVLTFAVPAAAGMVTRIDGGDAAKSAIDNFTISAGTF